MARLVFASLVTFGLLIGMVIGLVLAAMVASGEVNLTLAISLTVVINLVIWLISPWLSDLTLRWFNQLEFLDAAAVRERYPGVHQLIHEVADAYRFKAPRIGFIPDRNPTAFTYGLLRSNARVVVTQGIFEFLTPDEQRAVVAHELGSRHHRPCGAGRLLCRHLSPALSQSHARISGRRILRQSHRAAPSGQRADQDRLRHRPIEDTDATGEDVIFQDKTGLMAVDFRSMLGLIGNLFAGWKRVPKHLNEPGEATGWFRRGMGGYLILREPKTTVGSLRAKPFFWQVVLCLIVIIGSVFLV